MVDGPISSLTCMTILTPSEFRTSRLSTSVRTRISITMPWKKHLIQNSKEDNSLKLDADRWWRRVRSWCLDNQIDDNTSRSDLGWWNCIDSDWQGSSKETTHQSMGRAKVEIGWLNGSTRSIWKSEDVRCDCLAERPFTLSLAHLFHYSFASLVIAVCQSHLSIAPYGEKSGEWWDCLLYAQQAVHHLQGTRPGCFSNLGL